MSEMLQNESWERFWEGLTRAASCCRELAKLTDATEWKDLSFQLLLMRDKGRRMYKSAPLSEFQIQALVADMEVAQKISQAMNAGTRH